MNGSSCGDAFVKIRVRQVPEQVWGSAYSYKHALAYIVAEVCVLRYDNEAGRGDHRHFGNVEAPYYFTTVDQLMADFWADVDQWKSV